MLRVLRVVVAVALMAPAAATAKIDAQDVYDAARKTADFPLGPEPAGYEGGYVFCPEGMSAFTGGAFLYRTGEPAKPAAEPFVRVSSSTAAGGLNAWYADAAKSRGPAMTLRIVLKCLPEETLADATLAQDTASVEAFGRGSVRARCPDGMRAFTGGSFWHAANEGPTPSDALLAYSSSSTPTAGGDGWYADGKALSVARDLTAYAWCLPKRQLAGYTRAQAERKIGKETHAVKRAACPPSHPGAAAAGMFFHKSGEGIKERNAEQTTLYGMGVLDGPRSFLAAGRNFKLRDARLTARAFCLKK